jgi:capsular polysaccharide biosynthesis protein
MQMDNNNNQANSQLSNDYLKFDKQLLLLSIVRKSHIIIIVSVVATLLAFVLAKIAIEDTWQAQTVLIRHTKNLSSNTSVPYLYSEMDFDTILQSIKTRRNLQTIIDSLHLELTPPKMYGTIGVSRGRRSNLINIRAQHKERETAVNIANLLAEVFIQSYVEIINSASSKIYDYYLDQVVVYQQKIAEVEQRLDQFQADREILSLEKEVQNRYDNLKILELDMMNAQLLISELQTKISDIKERISTLPQTVELTSTVSGTRQSKLKNLQQELAILQQKYTEKNPKILKLRDEIAQLENLISSGTTEEKIPDSMTYGANTIRQSLILEKNRYENEMVATEKKIAEYRNKISLVKEELKFLSPIERQYYDIVNEQNTLQEMLNKVKERANEAKIAMESNLSDFEILEQAVAPKYPEASGRKIIALAAGFLVFLLLLIYFALKELLDFSVKSTYDFEQVLQIKCLEEIPNKESVANPVFYSKLQILYGQLLHQLPVEQPATIAVGKDRFSVGATFVIQELVMLALSQNKRVLWIESVRETDQEIEQYQINDQLYGKNAKAKEVYQLTDNFHIAYFVSDEQTFTKVLSSEKVEEYLKQQTDYDLIFWELFNVDYNLQLFKTIASSANILAFVARFRHSDRFKLSKAIKFLRQNSSVPIVGILNNSKKPYFKQ